MNGKEFWLRWRGEIIRGTVIFGLVVGVGLFVRSLVGRGRAELNGLRQAFNTDFLAPDRQRGEPWTYSALLPGQRTLWLRNVNGPITVEASDGHTLAVRAERTFRHSPVDSVRLVTAASDRGITICAVWPGESGACGPDGRYGAHGTMKGNDVAVVFTVQLPHGVKLDASTVNGDIEVSGASAPIGVGTVNGNVSVETSMGPVRAATVNGDAEATMRGFGEPGDVNVVTVHGDATVRVPANLDAVVDGHTVTGDISTDFPLSVTGKFASHALAGTLGKGGRTIHITTVAGDVVVGKVQDTPVPPRSPSPLSPPSPPRDTRRPR